jgi:hypothetical protein
MDQPWNTAWGTIVRVKNASTTGPVTTVETDITGLTATWLALANRVYRVSVRASASSTVVGDIAQVRITDAANTMQSLQRVQCATAGGWVANTWLTESFGVNTAVTRKGRVAREAGSTGNITILASPNNELLVEDLGPLPGTPGTLLSDRMENTMHTPTEPEAPPEPDAPEPTPEPDGPTE